MCGLYSTNASDAADLWSSTVTNLIPLPDSIATLRATNSRNRFVVETTAAAGGK